MSSATPHRLRFRRAVAALAALGVVAFGLTPFSAAYAANGNVTATILDVNNNPLTTQMVIEFPGGSTMGVTPDINGLVDLTLTAGTYTLRTWDFTRYLDWEETFNVSDDQTTALGTINLDQYPSVIGSVPVGLAGSVGVNTYRWNGSFWNLVSGMPVQTDSNGNFQFWFNGLSADWTLQFVPADSIPYATTYLGGDDELPAAPGALVSFTPGVNNSVLDLGETELIPAGIVNGTVTGYGSGPLSGAYVTAVDVSENYVAETQTDGSGNFTLKVPLDLQIGVYAYGNDWALEWYDNADDFSGASTRTLTSLDWAWSSVDFELFPEVTARFDIYADNGGTSAPFEVNAWLYHDTGSGYSPIPFDIDWEDATASFSSLPAGEYRLGLQLIDESGWIPFATTNTVPGSLPGATSSCYFEFVVNGDDIEIEFDVTAEPTSTACTDAPWVDGAGTPGQVTGTVDEIELMAGPVTATLFMADDYGDPFPIVTDLVNVDGTFALSGVYVDGDYFVGIEAGRTDPYLDTLFGDGDRLAMWQLFDDYIDGVTLSALSDYAAGLLPLLPASVLTGVVTLREEPVAGVCVELEQASSGNDIMCDQTDVDGRYYLKAPTPPPPGDYPLEYRIIAYPDGAFFPTYYGAQWYVGDIIEVESAGLDAAQYNIELVTIPSFIAGSVGTWDDDTGWGPLPNGVAHLYKKSGANWVSVDSFAVTQEASWSDFAFPSELIDVLSSSDPMDLLTLPSVAPGDYRIYFSQGGTWLPITEHEVEMVTLPDTFTETDTDITVCFVSLTNFALDTIAVVYEAVVDTEATMSCAPPGLPAPGGGGGGGSTPPKSLSPIIELVEDLTDDLDGEGDGVSPSPSPTAIPNVAPTPSPSPNPDPSADGANGDGPDMSWLWWAGGILLLIIIGGGTVLIIRRP